MSRPDNVFPLPVDVEVWRSGSRSRRVLQREKRAANRALFLGQCQRALNQLRVSMARPPDAAAERISQLLQFQPACDDANAPASPQNAERHHIPAAVSNQNLNEQQRRSQAALLPLISDFVRRAGPSADELADRIRGVQRRAGPNSGAALLEDGTTAYSGPTPAAQRIIASAIALPSTPATARIGKFLPGGTLELGKMLADPPGSTRSDKLLRGRFNGDSEEQPKLYQRMAAAGMLDWTTSPRCVNSLFAVGKPAPPGAPPVQRIIFDGRKCNRLFRAPPNPHLPAPDDFASLTPTSPGPVYAGTIDLSNFFHALLMPAAFRPFFCLPAIDPKAMGAVVPLHLRSAKRVWPMLRTVPMGWSWSVYLVQLWHVNFACRAAGLDRSALIAPGNDTRIDRVRRAHYIDDSPFFGHDEAAVTADMRRYIAAAERERVPVNPDKVVWPTADGAKVLGMLFDGVRRTIGVSPQKLVALCIETRRLLSQKQCTGRELEVLMGHWTWACLVRRPSLSVFSSVYHFIRSAGPVRFVIWNSVRRELHAAMGLVPLLTASLDAAPQRFVVASDASTVGLGVVVAEPPRAAPLCTAPDAADIAALPRDAEGASASDPDPAALTTVSRLACPRCTHSGRRVTPEQLQWRTVVAAPWRRDDGEHINELEVRAATTALRWASAQPTTPGTRLTLVVDSSVAAYAIRKGRSSSHALLRRLRVFAAHALAFRVYVDTRWVRSDRNPADGPSRLLVKPVVGPVRHNRHASSD